MKFWRSSFKLITPVGLFLLIGFFAPLHAQSGLSVKSNKETGFPFFNIGRFHLNANAQVNFDSNPSYSPDSLRIADLLVIASGGAGLQIQKDKIDFVLTGSVFWNQYLGVFEKRTSNFSGLQASSMMGLSWKINPSATLSLGNQLNRTNSPSNAGFVNRLAYVKNFSTLRLDLTPQEKNVRFSVSYAFDLNWFETGQNLLANANALSTHAHHFQTIFAWDFLPKTSLNVTANGGMVRYIQKQSQFVNLDLNPIKVQVGLMGYVTNKLSLNISGGYGNTITSSSNNIVGNSFSSFVALAKLTWEISEQMNLQTGYNRDFSPVTQFGWFSSDSANVAYNFRPYRIITLGANFQYSYQQFGKNNAVAQDRKDHLLVSSASIALSFVQWLTLTTSYNNEVRLSPFLNPNGLTAGYTRHIVGFNVAFMY